MKTFNHRNDLPDRLKKPKQSPGQLKEDKSIILYVLKKIKAGSSREQLTDIILRNIQFNYFDLQTYIDELINENYILESENNEGSKELILSAEGKQTIDVIGDEIPAYIRELIDFYIDKNQSKIRNRVTVHAEYRTIGPGNYEAVLALYENDLRLITLNINAPTEEDAIALCKKWKQDYQQVYADIIRSFV